MALPDSSDVEAALVARLQADTALTALCPDGVFYDAAFPGAKRFVIVSLTEESDEPTFGKRAIEDYVFLVKAVGLSTVMTNADVLAAGARIDAVLEDGVLSIPGFTFMAMYRESRVRYPEVDDLDPTIRWFHCGGQYRLQVSI